MKRESTIEHWTPLPRSELRAQRRLVHEDPLDFSELALLAEIAQDPAREDPSLGLLLSREVGHG